MLSTLHIRNYKSISDLSVSGLGGVNIIIGNNNSGKSSLLEALYLYAKAGERGAINYVLEQRGYYRMFNRRDDDIDSLVSAFVSLINGRSIDKFYKEGITIQGERSSFLMRMVDVYDEYKRDETTSEEFRVRRVRVYTPEQMDDVQMGENPALQILVNDEKRDLIRLDYPNGRLGINSPICPAVIVRSTQISSEDNATMFDRITMTFYESKLIEALKIIEPRITAINFIKDSYSRLKNTSLTEQRVPYVLLDNGQRFRLSSMGDGINRILTIILSLLNCDNGILLIDEFENGLHYSVQTKLWRIINEVAKTYNIQVFVTSHSNDCIRSFIDSGAYQDGTVIRLEKNRDSVRAIPFLNSERLKFAIDNNIEIR